MDIPIRTEGGLIPAFRWPNQEQGRKLPYILEDCPELAVIIDSLSNRYSALSLTTTFSA